jgi:hypothetical protein
MNSADIVSWYYDILYMRYDMENRNILKLYISLELYEILIRTTIVESFNGINIRLIIDKDRYKLDYGFTMKSDINKTKNIVSFLNE